MSPPDPHRPPGYEPDGALRALGKNVMTLKAKAHDLPLTLTIRPNRPISLLRFTLSAIHPALGGLSKGEGEAEVGERSTLRQ